MISCSIVVFVCKANSALSSVRRTHNSNKTPYKRDCKVNTFFSYLQIFSPKKRIFFHLFYKIHTFYQIFHTFCSVIFLLGALSVPIRFSCEISPHISLSTFHVSHLDSLCSLSRHLMPVHISLQKKHPHSP